MTENDQNTDGYIFSDLAYSEVGSIGLSALEVGVFYSSIEVDGKLSIQGESTLGRFYPKYFKVYQGKDADWAYPNSQTFTYMAQPFGVSKLFVEALNADKGKVVNYSFFDRDLWALFNIVDLSSHKDRFEALKTYSGTWKNANGSALVESRSVGEYTGSAADGLMMTKGSNTNYPDGPFNLNELGQNTQLSIAGASSADPVLVLDNESTLKPQPDIRFGRVNLSDAGEKQGTDTVIHIPLRVEYWNGERFTLNLDDSQTDVAGLKSPKPEYEDKTIWSDKKNQSGEYEAVDVALSAGGKVIAGRSRSIEATEAESNRQQSRVWLDLDPGGNDLPWLKYNWDKTENGEENPSSVVTFGIHRGNDRVIYRGEPGLTAQ
ncbi:hypothetical protein D1115_01995 [Vibrio alfacsensis]|uniref:DUF6701 domain-containing protein n=1 Tax=Vibrio alfacsensis TaxID=1074311 RepID=A0ABM6YR26_9VIBR|nr:hypothetical protein D1115_01995 [Vibrio alfacsensis]